MGADFVPGVQKELTFATKRNPGSKRWEHLISLHAILWKTKIRRDEDVKRYILKRLLQSIVTLLGITVIVFIILHLSGDPTHLLLPLEASAEDIALVRHEMGFDKPLYIQYFIFLKVPYDPSLSTNNINCSLCHRTTKCYIKIH